ncbi:MAG: CHC2 zinc finger domain-containing protein [Firmicutes bacterium]|nr:CHC2 zinc finger domain-containing protein [Bacillota bacterium]
MATAIDTARGVGIYSVIEKYMPGFVRPKAAGANACCPFHKDNSPSFHVYDKTNSFHCFSCGASGSGIDFVMRATGLCDPLAAAQDLCGEFGLDYAKEEPKPEHALYYNVYAYAESLFALANTRYVFPDGSTPNDYWVGRGLESVVAPYGLGYCPPTWKLNGRPAKFAELIKARFPGSDPVSIGLAQVSDEREFNAGRDKLLRQISQILIEQYKRKILSRLSEQQATECANAG